MSTHLLVLAGGVGGAKLALGLTRLFPPPVLTIVVNTGDDEVFHGLYVCPDLDTVMYTLAGVVNEETGWGVHGDTWRVMEALDRLGGETWFRLGDRDLATHLRRTELLHAGLTLTEATRYLCERFGVRHTVVPMSDDPVRTVVETDMGTMSFQEYFVRHRYVPRVQRLRFEGAEKAQPSPAFIDALAQADALIVCPSNPLLSITPILAIPGVRARLAAVPGVRVAVSPIIGGQAVKGPAAKLLEEVTGEPASCVGVARLYGDLCTHVVIDQQDEERRAAVEALGYRVTVAQTLMTSEEDKVALARLVGRLCGALP